MTATATSDGVSPETKGQIQEFVKEFCYFLECLHVAQVKPNGVAQSTPLNLLIPADAAASLFMSIRKDFRGRECAASRYPAAPKPAAAPRKARTDKMMQEAEKTVKAPPEVKKELETQGGRDPAMDREGADDAIDDHEPHTTDENQKMVQAMAKRLLDFVVDPHTGRVSRVPTEAFNLAMDMKLLARTENGYCVTFPVDV